MPTPTEAHLQVIAGKIEDIYKICGRNPVADPSSAEASRIILHLDEIGQTVHMLPPRFKNRYRGVKWGDMENWSAPNAFSPAAFDIDELQKVDAVFNSAEHEINRHAFPNKDIQAGVISSLDIRYEQLSKDWFDSRRGAYILISLTAFLAVVRGGLSTVDSYELTSLQILIYCVLLLPILWISFDIFWGRKIYRHYNYDAGSYYTYTEFYESASSLRLGNFLILSGLLNRQRRLMIYKATLWAVGIIISIIITILKVQ